MINATLSRWPKAISNPSQADCFNIAAGPSFAAWLDEPSGYNISGGLKPEEYIGIAKRYSIVYTVENIGAAAACMGVSVFTHG